MRWPQVPWFVPLALILASAADGAQVAPAVPEPVRPPVTSIEQLSEVVKPGTQVVVATDTGEMRGSLLQLDADSLSVRIHGEARNVPAASVAKIRLRNRSDRFSKIGLIIGLCAGFGLVGVAIADDGPYRNEAIAFYSTIGLLTTSGIGGFSGWALGSLVPGTTLYVAPTLSLNQSNRGPWRSVRGGSAPARTRAGASSAALTVRVGFGDRPTR